MTIKRMLIASGLVLAAAAAALVIGLIGIERHHKFIAESQRARETSLTLANELIESSQRLSTLARAAAATGSQEKFDAFKDVVFVRSGEKPRPAGCGIAPGESVDLYTLMRRADFTESELSELLHARYLADELIDTELQAMHAAQGRFPDGRGGFGRKGEPDVAGAVDMVYNDAYEAAVGQIMEPIFAFKEKLAKRLDAGVTKAEAAYGRAMMLVWIITTAVIALFALVLLVVGAVIVNPVLRCTDFARKVSGGDLNSRLDYSSGNEIGSLAESLRSMLQSLLERLTLKEKAEQAQRDAAQAAESASRVKSTFLANMSHEIRTPMNGIIGFSELGIDDPSVSPKIRDYLEKIKGSAEGLLGIINDILDISKIEAGKMDFEEVPFNMHDVFTLCENINGPKAAEKGLLLHFYAEPLVEKKLLGDPTRLRQTLLNLVSNSIKFTNMGVVKVKSLVTSSTADSVTLFFEVRDSGVGMSEEQVRKIFEPFQQADSSITRKYGGTGLGLSITKNIIELMGGELKVESIPGIGSKFSFFLTFKTIDVSAGPSVAAAVPSGIAKPRFSGDVLICEDNAINQAVIREHLSRIGLTPVVVENGKLGVEEVRKRMTVASPFRLILMDINMPVMDGLEAMARIKEMGCTTPVVGLTANIMRNDVDLYARLGMADCLGKPFTTQELWACLLKYIPQAEPTADVVLADDSPVAPDRPVVGRREAGTTSIDRGLGLEQVADDSELYEQLCRDFVRDYRNKAADIGTALAEGDYKLARFLAHTLKGVAGTIGAVRLASAAHAMEDAAARGEGAMAEGGLAALEKELSLVVRELEAGTSAETKTPA